MTDWHYVSSQFRKNCFCMFPDDFSVELYCDTNTEVAINNDYHFDTIYLFNVYTFVQIDVTPSKEDESELDKYQ